MSQRFLRLHPCSLGKRRANHWFYQPGRSDGKAHATSMSSLAGPEPSNGEGYPRSGKPLSEKEIEFVAGQKHPTEWEK